MPKDNLTRELLSYLLLRFACAVKPGQNSIKSSLILDSVIIIFHCKIIIIIPVIIINNNNNNTINSRE
jgi:hypothetical protein